MSKRAPFGCLAVLVLCLLGGVNVAQYPAGSPRPSPTPGGEQQAQPCPPIAVQPQPFGQVRDGQKIFFTANYSLGGGGDIRNNLTIVWNASAGSITSGTGTNRIEVDTTGAGSTPEREVRAEVWVSGYGPDCTMQASAVVKIIPPATKFGEFGEVSAEKFSTNIKTLAQFLSQSPSGDMVYVIVYAGRNSDRGFTQNWIKRIKTELSANGVADSHIYVADGGFREQPLFDFWIVPTGADPPRPEPTIKRSEIIYPKATPAKKP